MWRGGVAALPALWRVEYLSPANLLGRVSVRVDLFAVAVARDGVQVLEPHVLGRLDIGHCILNVVIDGLHHLPLGGQHPIQLLVHLHAVSVSIQRGGLFIAIKGGGRETGTVGGASPSSTIIFCIFSTASARASP